jgi:hypothetical protein
MTVKCEKVIGSPSGFPGDRVTCPNRAEKFFICEMTRNMFAVCNSCEYHVPMYYYSITENEFLSIQVLDS